MVLQLNKPKHPNPKSNKQSEPWTGYWIRTNVLILGNSLERRKTNDGESN